MTVSVLNCYILIQYETMLDTLLPQKYYLPQRFRSMTTDERALELGHLIREWRRQKGLSRAEAVNELNKMGVKISYGYLNKLELGDRSLATANVNMREGIRRLLGINADDWKEKTKLYVPEGKMQFELGATQSRASNVIQARMTEMKLTQNDLAEALGRSQAWVSQTLINDTEKTLRRIWHGEPELLHDLLAALKWDNDTLIETTGVHLGAPYPTPNVFGDEVTLVNPNLKYGTKRIPVFSPAGAGPGWDDGEIVEYIDIPIDAPGENAGYLIHGDSMRPEIPSKSKVIVRLQPYSQPNNIIVCWTPDDGMLCKVYKGIDEGRHVLESINSEYRPKWVSHINIYGVVWEVRKPIRFN